MRSYYIAYGSNMNIEQMRYRCPGATIVCTTMLTDYRITFRGGFRGSCRSGVANIEPRKGSNVPVVVWSITQSDEKSLDRYEGFPHLYQKETFMVKLPDLRTVPAMAYIMVSGLSWARPDPHYLGIIKQGYKDFEVSPRKLMYAARTRLEGVSPGV